MTTLPVATNAAEDIDLAQPFNGFRVVGGVDSRSIGHSSSAAGDFNGDGLGDFILGAPQEENSGTNILGAAYIVFGKRDSDRVRLDENNAQRMRLGNDQPGLSLGQSIVGIGDINGDGFDDIAIGDPSRHVGVNYFAGVTTVVFGGDHYPKRDLLLSEVIGVRIRGAATNEYSGSTISSAGDVNADGFADMLVGSSRASPEGRTQAGMIYVLYGRANPTDIDLADPELNGFRIIGAESFDKAGFATGIGDVNGDGYSDVLVGAPNVSRDFINNRGLACVIFGGETSADVDLRTFKEGGFCIHGHKWNGFLGVPLAGAGDVNGDGLADILLSDRGFSDHLQTKSEVYVVFGKRDYDRVETANLDDGGFRIIPSPETNGFWSNISGIGDINGDGLSDFVVGSLRVGQENKDRCLVVFGKTESDALYTVDIGNGGYKILAEQSDDQLCQAGSPAIGVGDINGDRVNDMLLADEDAEGPEPGTVPGGGIILASDALPSSVATYANYIPPGDSGKYPICAIQNGKTRFSPSSRTWVDFADGAGPDAGASLVSVTLYRAVVDANFSSGELSWEITTNRTGWSEVSLTFSLMGLKFPNHAVQLLHWPSQAEVGPLLVEFDLDARKRTLTTTVEDLGHFDIRIVDPIFSGRFES